jgi:hypothetical protein
LKTPLLIALALYAVGATAVASHTLDTSAAARRRARDASAFAQLYRRANEACNADFNRLADDVERLQVDVDRFLRAQESAR